MEGYIRHFSFNYYQLGLWRVQYLKRRCSVCDLLPTGSDKHDANKHIQAALVCYCCHQQIDWLYDSTSLTATVPKIAVEKVSTESYLFDSQKADSNHVAQFSDTFELQKSTLQSQETLQNINIPLMSAAAYTSYIRGALIAFKYSESLEALPILIHTLRQLPRPHGCHSKNSVILAVPTTKSRLVKRGFDPLAILAFYLSKHWKIPLWTGVSRIDEASSQQGLSRQERLHNIRNAFKITTTPPKKRVILFDDVTTTGSTLTQLAQILLTTYPSLKISAYTLAQA